MKQKLILTDSDGVLLDWQTAFHKWMKARGYLATHNVNDFYLVHEMYENLTEEEGRKLIRTFNESAAIGFLPALRDSMYYVRKLYEKHGYRFRVITSLSLDKHAHKLREMNLKNLFGDAIEDIIFLDTGDDKDVALAPYKDSGLYWIEDKPENAMIGKTLGLKSILMEHDHNIHARWEPYPCVSNWKDIYKMIISNE
jgi:FMN phosphatase YigB (HAD superfamily)